MTKLCAGVYGFAVVAAGMVSLRIDTGTVCVVCWDVCTRRQNNTSNNLYTYRGANQLYYYEKFANCCSNMQQAMGCVLVSI